MAWRNLGVRLYTGETSVDFVGRKRTWFIVGAVLILISIGAVLFRGMNFSIDFRGGVDYKAPVSQSAQPAESQVEPVREAVIDTGLLGSSEPIVTALGPEGGNQIEVQTAPLSKQDGEAVQQAIAEELDIAPSEIAFTAIGPTWGEQITSKGITSLVVFIALVMGVIWLYFREWRMSVSAIMALLHDLIITVGVYALVGFEVTPATIIGVLTILGYSLYDTVVVFDKVRENTRGLTATSRSTYSSAANLALNQTLVRSINTSIVALLPVGGILFVGAGLLGAGTLKDLSLALFVGIAAGTFSSIFIATPFLCAVKEREPAMKALRARVEKRERNAALTPSTTTTTSTTEPGGAEGEATTTEPAASPESPVSVGAYGELPPQSAARSQPHRPPRSRRSRGSKPKGGRGTGR